MLSQNKFETPPAALIDLSNNMNAYCVVKKVPKPAEVYIFANADEVTSFLWGKQPADWLVCKAVNELPLDLDQIKRRLESKAAPSYPIYSICRENLCKLTQGGRLYSYAWNGQWVECEPAPAGAGPVRYITEDEARARFMNAFPTEYFMQFDEGRNRDFLYRTAGNHVQVFSTDGYWNGFERGVAEFKKRAGVRSVDESAARAVFPSAFDEAQYFIKTWSNSPTLYRWLNGSMYRWSADSGAWVWQISNDHFEAAMQRITLAEAKGMCPEAFSDTGPEQPKYLLREWTTSCATLFRLWCGKVQYWSLSTMAWKSSNFRDLSNAGEGVQCITPAEAKEKYPDAFK
jgi:hypothetical protein